jgi:hypothetical protein
VDFDIDEFLSEMIESEYEEKDIQEAPTTNTGGMNDA